MPHRAKVRIFEQNIKPSPLQTKYRNLRKSWLSDERKLAALFRKSFVLWSKLTRFFRRFPELYENFLQLLSDNSQTTLKEAL